GEAGGLRAPDPEIHALHLDAGRHDGAGQVDLLIEFQSARLDGHGARSGSRLPVLIDDPYADPEFGEPEGEDKARRSRPDDQDQAVAHGSHSAFRAALSPPPFVRRGRAPALPRAVALALEANSPFL